MRRYLLDTGSAADLIYRRLDMPACAQEATKRGGRIGTATPVVGELYVGVELSATRERNIQRLIHCLSGMIVWPFDRSAAEEYGRLFATLKRRGRLMQQIDVQIAAIAISLGNCTVISKDSDLGAVPGLDVENWAVSPPGS
jgi:tRNA(fMet)-specific endonuclease VapC